MVDELEMAASAFLRAVLEATAGDLSSLGGHPVQRSGWLAEVLDAYQESVRGQRVASDLEGAVIKDAAFSPFEKPSIRIAEAFPGAFLRRIADQALTLPPDAAAVAAIDQLRREASAETIPERYVALVPNLVFFDFHGYMADLRQSAHTLTPLSVARDLCLITLTASDVEQAQLSRLYEPFPPQPDDMWMGNGIEFVRRVPRAYLVEEHAQSPFRPDEEFFEAKSQIDTVLTALRLLSGVRVNYTGIMASLPDWLGPPSRYTYRATLDRSAFSYFWCKPEHREVMVRLVEFLRRPGKGRKGLHVAARRVAYSVDKAGADDAIVDLMIAAEAIAHPGYSGDIRFRVGMRLAAFLSDVPAERRLIFDWLQAAYTHRNSSVHGQTPKAPTVGGTTRTPEEIRSEVLRLLRQAVERGLDRHDAGWPLADRDAWDDMLLGVVRPPD